MRLRTALALALASAFTAGVHGEGGRIRATVWDEGSDQPCASCTVLAQGAGIAALSLVTNADGRAVTDALPPGEYVVSLERTRSVGAVVVLEEQHMARAVRVVDGAVTEIDFGRH